MIASKGKNFPLGSICNANRKDRSKTFRFLVNPHFEELAASVTSTAKLETKLPYFC